MDDLIGVCFGRLTVIGYEGVHVNPCGTRRKMWRCRCACGKESIVAGNNLKNGSTKSCGCGNIKKSRNTTQVTVVRTTGCTEYGKT